MVKDLKKSMMQIAKMTEDMTNSSILLNQVKDAVTIFGSARLREGDKAYDDCVKLANVLSDNGISVFTGGGPGIMEAGNKGAISSKNKDSHSVAIGVELPHEQGINEHADIVIEHKYFATRKIHLTKHSNVGFIACDGGIGTLDEICEIACLINTKRLVCPPIVLINKEFYGGFIDWLKKCPAAAGCITPEEIDECFVLADDWKHGAEIILGYHKKIKEERE